MKIEKKFSLQNILCTENYSLQENFSEVCYKGSTGKKSDESHWNFYFGKKVYGKLLWWRKIIRGCFCECEYRGPTIEKKNYTLEKTFFSLNFIFLKQFWFVWYHSSMGVLTNDDINKKKFLEIKLSTCSFNKEFWITLLSVRVQSANA